MLRDLSFIQTAKMPFLTLIAAAIVDIVYRLSVAIVDGQILATTVLYVRYALFWRAKVHVGLTIGV